MPKPPLDIKRGDRFGHWTVLSPGHRNIDKNRSFLNYCMCDCGTVKFLPSYKLVSGASKSCGCCRNEDRRKRRSSIRLKNTWLNMKKRCYNPSVQSYKDYGAKGIGVCDEWRDNFDAFEDWALANGYTENLTIERIDYNKDYSPDNCKWATRLEQGNNKRNNVFITYDGKKLTISQWARELGMNRHALYARLYKYGWSVEKAFTTPIRKDRRYTQSAV